MLVANRAKVASQDAAHSLKVFATNPTGGLLPAYENLDKQRALGVGVAFGVLFDLCMVFGVQRILADLHQGLTSIPYLGFSAGGMAPSSPGLFKLLIFGLVPFVSITAAIAVAHMCFRGAGSYEGDVFTAGASLLPCALFVLCSSLLGIGNVEVIGILAVFALCYTILMIYTGCTRIARMPDAGAALAVPLILLLSVWLMKIIFTSIWQSRMGS